MRSAEPARQAGPRTSLQADGYLQPRLQYGCWAKPEISLTIANQELSELVKKVEEGESFVITRRGRPIAKLTPHGADKMSNPEWASAYRRMMALLDESFGLGGLRVNREEIYDR